MEPISRPVLDVWGHCVVLEGTSQHKETYKSFRTLYTELGNTPWRNYQTENILQNAEILTILMFIDTLHLNETQLGQSLSLYIHIQQPHIWS